MPFTFRFTCAIISSTFRSYSSGNTCSSGMAGMRRRMDEYVAICARLAEKHGCTFVDFQQMYEDYCKIRHSTFIAWDRVHPNRVGATLMARAFLEKCGFDYNH